MRGDFQAMRKLGVGLRRNFEFQTLAVNPQYENLGADGPCEVEVSNNDFAGTGKDLMVKIRVAEDPSKYDVEVRGDQDVREQFADMIDNGIEYLAAVDAMAQTATKH
jgi:hypothetical protein